MLFVQVVEHVAAYLGLDGTVVRERNFMRPNTVPPQWPVHSDSTTSNQSVTTKQAGPQRGSPAAEASISNGVKPSVHSMAQQEEGVRQQEEGKPKEVICGRYLTKGKDSNLQDDKSRTSPSGRCEPPWLLLVFFFCLLGKKSRCSTENRHVCCCVLEN